MALLWQLATVALICTYMYAVEMICIFSKSMPFIHICTYLPLFTESTQWAL